MNKERLIQELNGIKKLQEKQEKNARKQIEILNKIINRIEYNSDNKNKMLDINKA